MKESIQARCIICQLLFCCQDCRWKHEKLKHGLTYDCPICRGNRFLCRKEELNSEFLKHLLTEHAPLQCRKCNKIFESMEDFNEIDECTSISELIDKPLKQEVEERFDSIYDKIVDNDCDNFEAIVSVNNSTKTAVITPIVRKKNIVDYESSDTESESESKINITTTPHPKMLGKTPKLKKQRCATPHAKKFLGLMRQQVVEEYEEVDDDEVCTDSPDSTRLTPGRTDVEATDSEKMTTPISMTPHVMKLAQIVTTSTPTHPLAGNWSLFPAVGTESPLSEIENTESPAQSIDKEQKPEESQPKLKSIIVADGRRLGSQDSTDRQVTFQDSDNNTETSAKIKKVTFADDTKFGQECKVKRVFRKPKRMLTPGPQKRFNNNPRFQALINRFEHQAKTLARTPINKELKEPKESLENTPPTGEHNIPARAINFKEESPIIETDRSENTKDSNELFRTCVNSPDQPMNTAITALTANIAGSLQTCLSSVLRTTDEETEIQFKFTITKKKVSVKRVATEGFEERLKEIEQQENPNKDNIWSTVAKVVKNVFWGGQDPSTPYSFDYSHDSSSSSKRKFDEVGSPSPLNHKRHKYEGRIRGRPPLHSRCGGSWSHNVVERNEDPMNLSF
ncbi:uncharacterized protein LOC121734869 isoform X2 [Aricia agestis]|uniref:uncharacterized protein LOC121734869 isoform X2 n=1 Tax=Aricia agestis TaxID=91739 RepID=UPI001C20B490|nr:uncharacterized protein LOC121734869 isoform X2 [Aricia agestis]